MGAVLRGGTAGILALLDVIHLSPWWVFRSEGLVCDGVRSRGPGPFTHRHKLYLLLHLPHFSQERRAQTPELSPI